MEQRELCEAVVALLKDRGETLATAESCTGGLIAAALTDVPGVSAVFKGGVVSYWTQVKQEVLGVPAPLLERYGAVSPQTAAAMAQGARRALGSDLAVSVTGVAGPDPDERGNPVGLVYLALADARGTWVFCPDGLGAGRDEIRRGAVRFALDRLRRHLSGEECSG